MKHILKIIIVVIILASSLYAFNLTADYSTKEDLNRVSETINHLALKCYSIEGFYPPNLDYLIDHYGLLVNQDDYQILYYYEGSNLVPHVEVFKKERSYEQ